MRNHVSDSQGAPLPGDVRMPSPGGAGKELPYDLSRAGKRKEGLALQERSTRGGRGIGRRCGQASGGREKELARKKREGKRVGGRISTTREEWLVCALAMDKVQEKTG